MTLEISRSTTPCLLVNRPVDSPIDELESAWDRVVSTLSASRRQDQENIDVETDMNVTLLTGFLGSGKTTVLRHALEHPKGQKIAVVVNDVGEIEVDAHLIGRGTPSRVSLSNGCVCCALSDDLSNQLEALARTGDYDIAIVEASGVADPINIAQAIHGTNGCHLDGVVAVADPISFEDHLINPDTTSLLQRQLQAAHLVLLSKADLLDENALLTVRSAIAETAPGSRIISVEHGQVDVDVLCGAADSGVSLTNTDKSTNFEVVTAVVDPAGPWDPRQLGEILEQTDHQLLRAKGWFDDRQGSRYHLEVVGRRWSIEQSDAGPSPAVVLIGLRKAEVDAAAARLRALDRH